MAILFQVALFMLLLPLYCFATPVAIKSKVAGGPWRSVNSVEALKGQAVSLRVAEVEGASIRWFRIEPNIDIRYNNAVWPWLPKAYTGKEFDAIQYSRTPLLHFNGQWRIDLFPVKSSGNDTDSPQVKQDSLLSYFKRRLWGAQIGTISFGSSDVGSFWFQAEVTKGGQTYSTPGLEYNDERGLSLKVFRVSIKQKDDLLGNLTSYFNVPAVFGSTFQC